MIHRRQKRIFQRTWSLACMFGVETGGNNGGWGNNEVSGSLCQLGLLFVCLCFVLFLPCKVIDDIYGSYYLRLEEHIIFRNCKCLLGDIKVGLWRTLTLKLSSARISQNSIQSWPSISPQSKPHPHFRAQEMLSNTCLTWFCMRTWFWAMEFQNCACKSGI